MRDLNLDQLRAFLAVVEAGGFSAAARRLNLSQPAVSVQIRELESRLGLRLIDRLGKRAHPTAAGAELVEHGQGIMAAVEAAESAMRRHRDGWLGRVRIGTGAATLTYLLPPVLRDLRGAYPQIEVSVATGTTDDMIDHLMANRMDIGIVTLPVSHPGIELTVIDTKQLVAILPAAQGALPPVLRPADLEGLPLVIEHRGSNLTRLVLDWLAAGGVTPAPILEYDGLEAVKAIVAAGLGYSIIQLEATKDGVARDQLVVRPLDPALPRVIALARRRDKPVDRALAIVTTALMTLGGDRA
ncbi:LysR family transcriptional regulator [Zavarzinia sp.]|uniref:LysR family transcriptional regulator n=1 Tax=Zavarzinia sp. TaxID=2027920 RepID=UPI003BB59501